MSNRFSHFYFLIVIATDINVACFTLSTQEFFLQVESEIRNASLHFDVAKGVEDYNIQKFHIKVLHMLQNGSIKKV